MASAMRVGSALPAKWKYVRVNLGAMVILEAVDVRRTVLDGVRWGRDVKGRGVGCEGTEREFLYFADI